MKNLITIINLSIIIGIAIIFTQPEKSKESIENQETKEVMAIPANIKNAIRAEVTRPSSDLEKNTKVDESVIGFLQEMAESRLMDMEEGKVAQQRGTTTALKAYGSLMVKDQMEMLNDLKKIADRKNVSLPSVLGTDKADGLKDLKAMHGNSFDRKFIKMMIIDHKRDVKKIDRATRSGDADVQVFATKYLPFVQSHLEKIRALK